MKETKIIEMGGWCLIGLCLFHYGALLYLSMAHNYPSMLFGGGDTALTSLAASMDNLPMLFVLSIYPLLLLLLLPAGIATQHALSENCEGTMQVSEYLLTIAVIALILCALRWPSFNLAIAKAYSTATVAQKTVLGELYNAMNMYVGLYIGDVLGKTCFGLWTLITSIAVIKSNRFASWIGYVGLVTTAIIFVILASRFCSPLADTIARLHLPMIVPAWFIIFGSGLLCFKAKN